MIHTLPSLFSATVVSRPSKCIRSPYVADIQFEDGTMGLCHSPGLGCSGLVVPGSRILVAENTSPSKTEWVAHIADTGDELIGIHSLVTQQSAFHLLHRISQEATWASEIKAGDSRIDYVGYLPNGKKIYVEVKTAIVKRGVNAIFPDGYRKKKTDSMSPRAVKHAKTLQSLAQEEDTDSCHLLFIVSRDDCAFLVLNPADPEYRAAVQEATEYGVQVHAFALQYSAEGDISFSRELDVIL